MKRGFISVLLTSLVVVSLMLAACSLSTTTSTVATSTVATSTVATSTVATSTTTSIKPTTTTAITTTSAPTSATTTAVVGTTTTSTGNWWDTLGTPQYGGTETIQLNADPANLDPYNSSALPTAMGGWMEMFYNTDWTLNPSIFDYKLTVIDPDYYKPLMATGWEFSSPTTFVVHLRQDIYWQNIAPMNGRQFVASDVVFHYDRQYGLGDGYNTPDPNISLPAAGAPALCIHGGSR